ncbi:metallophosphoesterase [Curtobacterium sp. CFBP9011]|uniref:metallophosphoesterase family protein n=1 Tax=Curtobacterium sp. CFBP9011 TaxID=3096530 RepID=UPI002A6AB1C3|nr:metallophosphoesterase [Curtobacterium sp. CFBP9011]MDY1006344.1 metallophosphoesterase [Curtobacterium sp. CFBP9011]
MILDPRIAVSGDWHGRLDLAPAVIDAVAAAGIRTLFQLGDLQMLFHGTAQEHERLRQLSAHLELRGVQLFVVPGNHDGYTAINGLPIDDEGIHRFDPRIGFLPRGWRARAATGMTVAALGGANSIDVGTRGRQLFEDSLPNWWSEESITATDLAALGHDPVDFLLAHDAPASRALGGMLERTDHLWDPAGLKYSKQGQRMFHRGFLQVKPRLVVSGHYHLNLDAVESYVGDDGASFESRSVILNKLGLGRANAVVDLEELSVELLEE